MRKQKGFSLIELLIVVAIILIIAAIAIPNLLSARKSANESSAVGSLRTINTAEVSFQGKHNAYTCTLADLGPAPGDAYLDNMLAGATLAGTAKSGYFFQPLGCGAAVAIPPAIAPVTTPVVSYQWWGEPANQGVTGNSSFCTDTSAVIWKDVSTPSSGATCLGNNPRVPIG
jgi:prepilin-type N-terminal cleavage/methylation domain-containing protein